MKLDAGAARGIGRSAAAEDQQRRGDRHVGRAGDDDAQPVREPPLGEGRRYERLLRPGRGRGDPLALRGELVGRGGVRREGPAQRGIGMLRGGIDGGLAGGPLRLVEIAERNPVVVGEIGAGDALNVGRGHPPHRGQQPVAPARIVGGGERLAELEGAALRRLPAEQSFRHDFVARFLQLGLAHRLIAQPGDLGGERGLGLIDALATRHDRLNRENAGILEPDIP